MITKASDLVDMIDMADMTITKNSTCGYTAILMLKPLIVFEYDKADIMNYVKTGCALHASNKDELAEAIAELKPRAKLWVLVMNV